MQIDLTTRVAVVQMPFVWAVSPQEYFDRMNLLVADAARAGAGLVVLPEHTGDMLAGMFIPGAPTTAIDDDATVGPFASWSGCVRATSATTAQFLVHTFESLASHYQVYILPGTLCLPASQADGVVRESDPVFRAAFLFGPDGQVIAEQRQLRPNPDGRDKLGAGETLGVTKTSVGRIAILIGDDATDVQSKQLVSAHAVDLLLRVSAPRLASEDSARAALRSLVETGHVFALDAQLSGEGFAGQSAIFAPAALTPSGEGIIAQSSAPGTTEVVCADLGWSRLRPR